MKSSKTISKKQKKQLEQVVFFFATLMNKPQEEAEIVPILYHLADDPAHLRLLEVCKKDIQVLNQKKKFEKPVGRLHSFVLQAEIWFERNSVTELPDSDKHWPSPGAGLIRTKTFV